MLERGNRERPFSGSLQTDLDEVEVGSRSVQRPVVHRLSEQGWRFGLEMLVPKTPGGGGSERGGNRMDQAIKQDGWKRLWEDGWLGC